MSQSRYAEPAGGGAGGGGLEFVRIVDASLIKDERQRLSMSQRGREGCDSEGEAPAPTSGGSVEVGRMVDSSQADDRRMIRLVRERRLLYARNNMPVASYYSQVKGLWEEVAREMGWTADVRRKWSHIRNSYSRHLRNEMAGARTGRGRAVSRWYLADELDFLRDHMATDMRPSPYSTFAPTYLEMELAEQSAAAVGGGEHVDVKPFIHTPWFALGSSPAPASAPRLEPKHEPHSEDSSGSQAFGPDENSSYFQFFRGIYNDYEELSTRKRRLFKRRCLDFLHELLDEQDGAAAEGEQHDAVNLSHSAGTGSDDGAGDTPVCIVEKVHTYSILPND